MEKTFNFVHFQEVTYQLNHDSGRFEKQPEKINFPSLPFELWIEETREERFVRQGANEVVSSRIKNGKKLFYTGLRPIAKHYYYGDHYKRSKGEMKKSLCVFWLSPDNRSMNVYYFNNFYKESKKLREEFIISFINSF